MESHRLRGAPPASWMPSTRSQAIHVGGEQPAACRFPFRVGLPGLSEHRSEDDDIARSHVLANRAVSTTTFNDPLHGAVDLIAHREGFRDRNRRPAMQRQYEVVTLGARVFEEAPQRFAGCRAVAFSRPCTDSKDQLPRRKLHGYLSFLA